MGVLDKTHTAMGSRKMRQWLREPLNDAAEINERLDGVEELYNDLLTRNNIKENLKRIYDFERLTGPVSYTHLDVYKRQAVCFLKSSALLISDR